MPDSVPPPLPWSVRTGTERLILAAVAAFAFVGAILLLARHAGFSPSFCTWKGVTGLPCAGCGGTRATSLLLVGDLGGALTMNPGAVFAAAFAAVLAVYASVVLLFRLEPLRLPVLRGKMWRFAVLLALAANWIYLLVAGRI